MSKKFDVFSNKFAQDIYKQKYSMDGVENWVDTSRRVVNAVCGQLLSKEDQEEIYKIILERKFIPGGRYLYSSGRPLHQVNNCFKGDESFLTDKGCFTFEELEGEVVNVRNWKGEWEPAEVKYFGVQKLVKMTLSNGDVINTTAEHLWIQPDGSRVTTKDVERVMLSESKEFPELDQEGIRHGIIYGDGYKNPKTGYTEMIIVNPEKDEPLASYFKNETKEITVGFGAKRKYQTIRKVKAGTKIALQPKYYKELPTQYTPEYARGFIAGLIATDGHASLKGSVLISCEGFEKAKEIRKIAIAAGCVVSSVRINSKVNPYTGEKRELSNIYIKPFSAPIILPSHKENMEGRKFYKRELYLDVVNKEFTDNHDKVYCVVAPKTNTFTLANGVLTSNCFLFRAEDSREGWADAMQKATSALMTGGGIGFDYSALREKGAKIKRTGGTSTGPLALMNMVNESGRYIMQGGQRRCLPEGSRVQTKKGLVPIEEIEINDLVMTTDGYRKVKAKMNQGVQQTIKIKTQNGELVCTPNHRVAVVTSIYGDYKWVEAQNLKEGDRLYFTNTMIDGTDTDLPENDFQVSPNAYTLNRITIPKLDTEIAWLLGLIHGDGYVMLRNDNKSGTKRHGRVQIACSKDFPEIKDKAVAVLKRFGTNVKVKQGDGNLWNVTTSSVELAYYFSKFKKSNEEISVPEFIMRGKPEIRAAYIAGLMDADGSESSRPILIAAQIYPNYLKEVQNLCSSLGIATRFKVNRKENGNWKTLYHLTVSTGKQLQKFKTIVGEFGHKCNFKIPKGTQQYSYSLPNHITNESGMFKHRSIGINTSIERIEKEIGEQLFTPVKVLDLSINEELSTWDIEVEDKTEFFVNGYLVHNSAIWAGLNWSHPDINSFMKVKNWSDDIKKIKEKDFNFPVPMELTNISVIYDTEFFIAMDDKKHSQHKLAKDVWNTNCLQAFSTAEPGFSFNFRKDAESLRNACTEVTSEDDSDKCNLGTIWINRILDEDELAHVTKYATKFLLCGGIYSDVPTKKIKEVGDKNNRIGLGLGGIHEWLMLRGYGYQCVPELHKWLSIYEHESDSEAFITARKLGVAIPKGIRAIAPTGTIGILAETTTGIEPLFCKAYKRRYLKNEDWVYQYVVDGTVKRLLDQGVSVDQIQDSYDLSFKDRVKFQADVQNYVDMAISSTCNLPAWGSENNNEETLKKDAKTLLKYAKRLRGFTCYPDGCRGGQPLTRVDLEEAKKQEGVVFEESEAECVGGVCGI